jgi:predicted HicB family RNase H-like nuclease
MVPSEEYVSSSNHDAGDCMDKPLQVKDFPVELKKKAKSKAALAGVSFRQWIINLITAAVK